jgi:hypothetical protein
MIRFTPSTEQDFPQLTEWIQSDPYHKDCLNPGWWITGNGFLAFCLQDSHGPTMYARVDVENDSLRLHCQFAPESEVSKPRVVKSLLFAIPKMKELAKHENLTGLVTQSTSEPLIKFLSRLGFVPATQNDYILEIKSCFRQNKSQPLKAEAERNQSDKPTNDWDRRVDQSEVLYHTRERSTSMSPQSQC